MVGKEKAPQDLAVMGDSTGDLLKPAEIVAQSTCIDMLRLTFNHEYSLDCDALQYFDRFRPTNGELGNAYHSRPTPIGRYEYMYRWPSGDSAIAAGLFLNDGTKRDVTRKKPVGGFLEFNPQKVDERDLQRLVPWVAGRYPLNVSRWDFAADYQMPRSMFSVDKGRRNWDAHLSRGALTETIGKRNNDGYVKVYDKGKESNVDGYPVTRIEITNEGMKCQWPIVYVLQRDSIDLDSLSPMMRLILLAVEYGAPFERVLASFDTSQARHMWRKKFRKMCVQVPDPADGISRCLCELARWERGEVVPRQELFWEKDVRKVPDKADEEPAGQEVTNG